MADFGWLWGASGEADNQEVEHQSGASRLMNNICCAICGTPILLLISVILLGWNERRSVCNSNAIHAGKAVVEEVGCNSASEGDGKLVLFSCDLSKEGLQPFTTGLGDFSGYLNNYVGTGLKIDSAMYQCIETEKSETKKDNVGGGKTTIKTYTYTRDWRNAYVDSNAFHRPQNKQFSDNRVANCGTVQNPPWPTNQLPASGTLYADSVKIGAFTLGKSQIKEIQLTAKVSADSIPPPSNKWTVSGNGTYYNTNAFRVDAQKGIGNARVGFKGTDWSKPKHTVLGKNAGGKISSWTAPDSWLCSGFTLEEVKSGTVNKDDLFKGMANENSGVTWLLRLIGFILAWVAFCLLAGPLEVAADCIPCIGPYLGDSIACIACCVSCLPGAACAMAVIAVVWVVMRPLVGLFLLVVFCCVIGGFVAFKMYSQQKKGEGGGGGGGIMPQMVGGGGGGCTAPVPEGTARGFIQALRNEYANGNAGSVGQFFDQIPGDQASALEPYEDQVRNAADANFAINQLAQSWGL